MRTVAIRITLCLALAAPSLANQIIVDASNGPGTNFTDIPPAVAAALPGDVIVVRAGSYNAFTVDRRLTVVGQGTVVVNGALSFTNLVAGQRAAVVNVLPSDVVVANCQAPVILQDVTSTHSLRITGSSDVRLRAVQVQPFLGLTTDALIVDAGRLEAVSSGFRGSSGWDGYNGPAVPVQNGGTGIRLRSGARAHLALSDVIGGDGSFTYIVPLLICGNGGSGAWVEAGELVLAGGGSARALGGWGGANLLYNYCDYDGFGGPGIVLYQPAVSLLVHSGTTIEGRPSYYGSNCTEIPGTPITGGGAQIVETPVAPTLSLSGATPAGAFVVYTLRGVPGGLATWWFGRSAILVADPGIRIERLANAARTVALGVIPVNGEIQFTIQIPSSSPIGAFLCTQAEVLDPSSGTVQRTNSVPIVVR